MNFKRKFNKETTSLKEFVECAEKQGATEIERILPDKNNLIEVKFGTRPVEA